VSKFDWDSAPYASGEATVSAILRWSELGKACPTHFNILTVRDRLGRSRQLLGGYPRCHKRIREGFKQGLANNRTIKLKDPAHSGHAVRDKYG
jgi:DNA primase